MKVVNGKRRGSVTKKVGSKSMEFPVREMPAAFLAWNLGQRVGMLKRMRDSFEGKEVKRSGGGFGAHLPVYITHNPKEALFPFNAATKGTGFVAKDKFLKSYIELFNAVRDSTEVTERMPKKQAALNIIKRIDTLLSFYEDIDKIDTRCLAGLEIWPGTTTKNFHADPRVSLHFLGMSRPETPTRYEQWQVNCVWEKIEVDDVRYQFGKALRSLTLGGTGRSFVPGHVPTEHTPTKGAYPFGWVLWVSEVFDKGIDSLPA